MVTKLKSCFLSFMFHPVASYTAWRRAHCSTVSHLWLLTIVEPKLFNVLSIIISPYFSARNLNSVYEAPCCEGVDRPYHSTDVGSAMNASSCSLIIPRSPTMLAVA